MGVIGGLRVVVDCSSGKNDRCWLSMVEKLMSDRGVRGGGDSRVWGQGERMQT